MKVGIIGAGSWGCSLGRILADNGNDVMMFDLDKDTINQINTTHTTPKLPNGKLPENIVGTISLEESLNFSNLIVLCVPTKVIRSVLKNINNLINCPKLFINASKGVEPDTFKRVSEIVYEEIDRENLMGYVAVYGPTHAEEVIKQKFTLACSVSDNEESARLVQKLFNNPNYFGVYTNNDIIGAEWCGALKNVYALAGGMLEGLGYGDNAKAGLITRALVEIRKIVLSAGGNENTIWGLTGVGDLIATATSHDSRNFQVGYKIATGESVQDILSSATMVVEGVRSAKAVYGACKKLNIDCPIIDAIYNILYNNHDIKEILKALVATKTTREYLDN